MADFPNWKKMGYNYLDPANCAISEYRVRLCIVEIVVGDWAKPGASGKFMPNKWAP